MNLDELRTAFTFAERIVEQIKEFRSSRIDALAASGHEDIPVNLADGPRMVLHLVPLTIADPGNRITFTSLDFVSKVFKVDGEWIHSKYARPNLDGVLMPKAPDSEGHINEYYQVFRSGACEYVQVYPLDSGQNKILNTLKKENHAIQSLKYLLGFHKELGINLPAAVMLTFVGIKGYQLIPNSDCRPYAQNNPSKGLLNKTNLLLPDVIVDTFSSKPEIILKPIFDVLCNAGGWNRSMSYDNVGNWIREE